MTRSPLSFVGLGHRVRGQLNVSTVTSSWRQDIPVPYCEIIVVVIVLEDSVASTDAVHQLVDSNTLMMSRHDGLFESRMSVDTLHTLKSIYTSRRRTPNRSSPSICAYELAVGVLSRSTRCTVRSAVLPWERVSEFALKDDRFCQFCQDTDLSILPLIRMSNNRDSTPATGRRSREDALHLGARKKA